MKAQIQEGKIINFVSDGFEAGKDFVGEVKDIKGFADGIEMDKVSKNQTMENSIFIYYLDNGIVQKLEKGNAEYDEAYVASQKAKRAAEYPKEADGIFFKFQRGEATEQEWKDAVQKVKDKYPYEEVK